MHLYTTAIASVAIAALVAFTEAHSWIECTDWRFNDPKKPGWLDKDGTCQGYARKFPLGFPFGTLDGPPDLPIVEKFKNLNNRHYQQDPKNLIPCSDGKAGKEPGEDETRQSPISNAYGGLYGNMASVTAGNTMCIRWPAKNHAVKDEVDRGVFINMPQTILTKDPDQDGFTKANLVESPYKNCTFISNTDKTACGACFQIPPTLKTGDYVIQWRWQLNPGEWYTSCWDLAVAAPGGNNSSDPNNSASTLDGSTSVFAELAEFTM